MFRQLLKKSRIQTSHVTRFASHTQRTARYGLDLVLWARLFNKRRTPIPIDLPRQLLDLKNVECDHPVLFVADSSSRWKHWEEGFRAILASLFLNLQNPDIISPLRYAHPAPSFNGIYLWDSAFIAQIWKYWDSKVAWEINQAVLAQQEEGRLQHVVASFTESLYTQPPLLAWSFGQLLRSRPDVPEEVFVREIFEPLVEYHEWLNAHRRHETGLYFWEHPYESGIDNSPRFSSRDESDILDTRHLLSPDFATYMTLQCEALENMADRLGDDAQVRHFGGKAREIRELANQHLWCEEDGYYYDWDLREKCFLRTPTIASLLPLWAGIPDQSRADALRWHIIDPDEFGTPIPFPTVARNHPQFEKDMWRGPVWINTAYAVLQGMFRYQLNDDAAELTYRLCNGVYSTYANMQKFYEFYDPERNDLKELQRKQGNHFKWLTLGAKPVTDFVGWTGLVNTLVIENLLGLSFADDELTIRPHLPAEMIDLGLGLRLPERNLSLSLDRDREGVYHGILRTERLTERFTIPPGASWRSEERFSATCET